MTTQQYVSYGLGDAVASTVVPPGRYFIKSAKFIDTFDYNKTQKPGTAAVLTFEDDQGRTWDQEYGIGDKTRIYPDESGQRLVGAQISESCGWFFLLKNAIQVAGLPETRLWEGDVPAQVQNIFAGIWGDWINVLAEGKAKTRKTKDGKTEEAFGTLVPAKFYMDGGAPAATAPAAAPAQAPPAATPPAPAAPAQAAAPPPAAPPATPPAAPPAPEAATPPPPAAAAANGAGISARFGEMLEIAKVAVAAGPQARAVIMTEVFGKITTDGLSELDAAQLRADAMTSVSGEFTDYMVANGMKIEAEMVSVA